MVCECLHYTKFLKTWKATKSIPNIITFILHPQKHNFDFEKAKSLTKLHSTPNNNTWICIISNSSSSIVILSNTLYLEIVKCESDDCSLTLNSVFIQYTQVLVFALSFSAWMWVWMLDQWGTRPKRYVSRHPGFPI